MDWSKIKTIFILTFLILDVYLLYQFMKLRDANKYEFITQASFEDKLKADDIKVIELPKTSLTEPYISANPKVFSQDDIEKLKGQKVSLKDDNTLVVKLKNPVQLSANSDTSEILSFVNDNVLFGGNYQFWDESKKKNTITLYQQFENKTLYKNINGKIIFHLNKQHQLVSYEQTYLEGIEKFSEKEEILPPMKAVETLYQKGLLKPKSKVTAVDLGYSTLVQLAASQVLAPTWHIVVNGKEDLFVNAFEGQIIDFNQNENKAVE